jgi:hypothetical protein
VTLLSLPIEKRKWEVGEEEEEEVDDDQDEKEEVVEYW